jgi:hypothetical protein
MSKVCIHTVYGIYEYNMLRCMVHGVWCMVCTVWCMVCSVVCMVHAYGVW